MRKYDAYKHLLNRYVTKLKLYFAVRAAGNNKQTIIFLFGIFYMYIRKYRQLCT